MFFARDRETQKYPIYIIAALCKLKNSRINPSSPLKRTYGRPLNYFIVSHNSLKIKQSGLLLAQTRQISKTFTSVNSNSFFHFWQILQFPTNLCWPMNNPPSSNTNESTYCMHDSRCPNSTLISKPFSRNSISGKRDAPVLLHENS